MPSNYLLVDTQAGLKRAIPVLNQADTIAVDVEFDNKYSYELVVCLIQISTSEDTFLFDPLAIDLSVLSRVLSDPDIIKLFFAGIQDIQILQTQYNWQLQSVVDLSTIYQVVNNDNNQSSLNNVIQDILSINIPKNRRIQSREDWKQRPLPDEMLVYAAKDVQYLHDILVDLQNQLSSYERDLLEVYFMQIPLIEDQVENSLMYAFYLCQNHRIRDIASRHLMFKLVQLRERIAERTDQASGYIISRSNLLTLVEHKPTSVSRLKELDLYYRNMKKYAEDILEVINENTGTDIDYDPYYQEIEDIYQTYYPYEQFLTAEYNWPFDIDIKIYKQRRVIVKVLKEMIRDRFGEEDMSYLFTRYLQHQIAVHEQINLYDFRTSIEQTDSSADLISAIYRITSTIYELL